MSSKRITHKSTGELNKLTKRTKKSGYVEVGVVAPKQYPGEAFTTTADIAAVNEFGTEDGSIPERSFMRSTLKQERANIRKLSKKLLAKIVKGQITTDQGLAHLGQYLADRIQQKIVTLRTPPNDPQTIKRKKSSNPLIDTGQLKNAITYRVVDAKLH